MVSRPEKALQSVLETWYSDHNTLLTQNTRLMRSAPRWYGVDWYCAFDITSEPVQRCDGDLHSRPGACEKVDEDVRLVRGRAKIIDTLGGPRGTLQDADHLEHMLSRMHVQGSK